MLRAGHINATNPYLQTSGLFYFNLSVNCTDNMGIGYK